MAPRSAASLNRSIGVSHLAQISPQLDLPLTLCGDLHKRHHGRRENQQNRRHDEDLDERVAVARERPLTKRRRWSRSVESFHRDRRNRHELQRHAMRPQARSPFP